MTRNPIYQALRTTGIVDMLGRSHRNNARVIAANALACRKLDHILDLYELGVIDHKELRDLTDRARRPYHAAILWAARAGEPLASRRRAVKGVRTICPPGTTSYDLRMGKTARV